MFWHKRTLETYGDTRLVICGHRIHTSKAFGECKLSVRCPLHQLKLIFLASLNSIARVDDVIILSTGEKIVPGPMENDVLANPGIKSVVMFGRGRAQAGMLVELQAGASSHTPAASRQLIW
jgi:hypothetical protein